MDDNWSCLLHSVMCYTNSHSFGYKHMSETLQNNNINVSTSTTTTRTMGAIFVDFEAFQHGATERFKLKELCVLSSDRPLTPLYFLFRASPPWEKLDVEQQKTYAYQSRHLHHLEYSEGVASFCKSCVARMIKAAFPEWQTCIFYVMGAQKMDYLRHKFPMFNWCEYNGVTVNTLPTLPHNITCLHRPHGDHCACLKCYKLYHHYITLPL